MKSDQAIECQETVTPYSLLYRFIQCINGNLLSNDLDLHVYMYIAVDIWPIWPTPCVSLNYTVAKRRIWVGKGRE